MTYRKNPGRLREAVGSPALQIRVMVTVAVLLGGGGVSFGLNNLTVQLVAIALLAANGAAVAAFFRDAPRPLVYLVGASLALPLLQCVPLPPPLWQALPGRDLVTESFALAGLGERWFSWSVNPWRTGLSALALLPPFTVLVLAARLTGEERRAMLVFLVWLALAGFALGAVQVLTDNRVGNLYPGARGPLLFATFANRNSAGLFLAVGLVAVLFLPVGKKRLLAGPLRYLVAALLLLGILLTQSRSALALAGAATFAWAAFGPLGGLAALAGIPARRRITGVVLGLAVIAGALALAAQNERLGHTFERFGQTEFNRPEIWEDGLYSAKRFWPVGSGVGTFDEVFQLDESLEYLMAARAGRAHNDYLEVVIEAGMPGILLLLGWLVWLIRCGLKSRAGGMDERGAAVALTLVALQSVVDYPLRNEALLCIAALLAGIAGRIAEKAERGR